MELPQRDDYQQLFLSDTRMLDVRAPVEFAQGAFPHSENFPLMNDEERQRVGLRYKEQGQESAIELGHKLVSGEVKQQRLDTWAEFIRQHPNGVLYCFRGGLRSRISQQWLFEHTGIIYPRVKGGYKAMRRFLLEQLVASLAEIQPIVLSGRTGAGKTLLLSRLEDQIDLEDIYKHRGSAFGKRIMPQPSQVDIENELSIALLKQRSQHKTMLVFEDEARNIGSRKLPDSLTQALAQAPLVVLERAAQQRIDIVFDEYISKALAEHQQALGEEQGFQVWSANLLNALDRIQRRLGGVRHKTIRSLMLNAIQQHHNVNQPDFHRLWIQHLLTDYYDPMYDYQLAKKAARIIFRGDEESILQFLQSRNFSKQ